MIKKYNEFLNEKLSDKLSGFNADELYQQFLDGKLTPEKFLDLYEQYNIKIPDDFEKIIKDKLYNNEMLVESYLRICKTHNLKTLSKDELLEFYKSKKITFDKYITLCNKYNIDVSIDDAYNYIKNMTKNPNIMLDYACRFNFPDLFKIAIQNGGKLRRFSLLDSIKNNNLEIVKLILKTDDKTVNDFDNEPLRIAIKNNNIDIVKLLLKHNAIVTSDIINLQMNNEINNLLKKYYNSNINEKLSDKLSGFNKQEIEQQFLNNKIGYTKYKEICENYNVDLLPNEIIFETIKKYNKNILDYCLYSEYIYGIKKIFDSLNKEEKERVLYLGTNYENLDIIKLAINGGVDVHYSGDYALLTSTTTKNSFEIVKFLVEHGANIHIFNENPLYNAVSYFEQYDTVKYLLEQGAIVTNRTLRVSETNENKKITNLVKKYYKLQHDKEV